MQCQSYRVIPLKDDTYTLTVAAEQVSPQRDAQLGFATNRHINTTIWPSIKFQQVLSAFLVDKSLTSPSAAQLDRDENTVINLINQVLCSALKQKASDIHFEPYDHQYRIRYRIDGVLHIMTHPDYRQSAQITTRLKIMAKLDIAERRLPQDGQLVFDYEDQPIVMRTSTIPVHYGEKIVLRIVQQNSQQTRLEHLGMNESALDCYQKTLQAPQGLILVCGPTGSGKTMTLYGGLHELNHPQRNICTVEDPIELYLPGINQTPIQSKSGITFTQILRAFLRQDPDVIMIGEIRDKETAQIAMQAAHTGHLVLSTLHTNSSCEAVLRLNQMGIANYLLASGLKLVIAQRLVRLLCQYCKKVALTPLKIYRQTAWEEIAHFEAQGCEHCVGGYYGRTGIYELLTISPAIQQLLFTPSATSIESLKKQAAQQGMTSLYQSGINLVKTGLISFAELARVINIFDEEELPHEA
ncbi:ATPase, T2SS/T4P/T4SS family [Utexia brackfieldae]|uniref:GspE/PulE family protein n=1 Tax=Utexia brackfieldae TaxID=3074108 RepID=UPI00370DC6ED